jgi:hypothetical protein
VGGGEGVWTRQLVFLQLLCFENIKLGKKSPIESVRKTRSASASVPVIDGQEIPRLDDFSPLDCVRSGSLHG